MPGDFVHLRIHSDYSLDSVLKIPSICGRVAGLGMRAAALSDNAVLTGAYEFREAANASGIKPIFGCEVTVPGGVRLNLLAETAEGFQNLSRIVSLPRKGDFPGEQIVGKEDLKRRAAGLIAFSPCCRWTDFLDSPSDWERGAGRALEEFLEIFGAGNFFLELSDAGLPGQPAINVGLIRLARRIGASLAATQDCRHLGEDDESALQTLLCIKENIPLQVWRYRVEGMMQLHIRSAEEMEQIFGRLAPEALRNTLAIAERCDVTLPERDTAVPRFDCPGELSAEEHLRRLAFDGLATVLRDPSTGAWKIPPELEHDYTERLEDELAVVAECGLGRRFLIYWDVFRFARERGIPVGPGRGSAPGSLLAHALGVTGIDPLRYGLHFERFLNPLRNRVPEIDLDVCAKRRGEILRYLAGKYGDAGCAGAVTHGTLKAETAIRKVGKVMGLPEEDVDEAAEALPANPFATIRQALTEEGSRLGMLVELDPEIGELVSTAEVLEGTVCRVGRHVSKVVIVDGPISERVPVFRTEEGLVTQYDSKTLKKAGIFSMDILPLAALSEMGEADDIPLDDEETYAMLSRGETAGVFQCESEGFRKMLGRLAPACFGELVDLIALYRPSPLIQGLTERYIERRRHRPGLRDRIRTGVPEIDRVLVETCGFILYQEQVMELAAGLAGFSMREADRFRVAVGRKKEEESERFRERFIAGGIGNGHPRERMEEIFGKIREEGGISFNRSHAIAYGLLAYRSAYRKLHVD